MFFRLCLSFVNCAHQRKSLVAEMGERKNPSKELIICRGNHSDVKILQTGRLHYLFTQVSCCASEMQ